MKKLFLTIAALALGLAASAQPGGMGMGGFQMPEIDVTFDPYVEAPAGFDAERPDIARGTIESIEYKSESIGTIRKELRRPLSKMIISGKIKSGDHVKVSVDKEGNVKFEI